MTTSHIPRIVAASFLLLVGWGAAASAQPPPPPVTGPLVLEPMHNGFILAPEIKVTRFDDKTGTLAGGYGGRVKDEHLLIGGAGYGLVDRGKHDRNLAYGGFVIGWFFNPDQPVSVSAKTLAGYGRFSEPVSLDAPSCLLPEKYLCWPFRVRDRSRFDGFLRFSSDFFVVEPEVDVVARLGSRSRFSAGVGYRLTDERRAFDREAHGVTGAFSVQLRF